MKRFEMKVYKSEWCGRFDRLKNILIDKNVNYYYLY